MAHHLDDCLRRLATAPAVLVSVTNARGSVPRENGTWMAVFGQALVGTIGGGHLEWDAIRQARDHLREPRTSQRGWTRDVVLGPSLGQCCGGALTLCFEPIGSTDAPALSRRLATPLTPVALFGGGHVGSALVQALAALPFSVRWIDSRDEVFPSPLPATVQTEHSDPVAGRGARSRAGFTGADHELFPRRRPGHRGRLPAAPARRRAICRSWG